ncbi:hypothetical protein T12_6147 [Trichinella patagoniensis]|uniref:Uncharacterized protein n=1 Tax=Trichinella patagoniensis TaxID=990121 RepID=A0A0V1ACZ6_9BILA|nr:hypothetical protein T12_6147 [Trichinella patagoniensis]
MDICANQALRKCLLPHSALCCMIVRCNIGVEAKSAIVQVCSELKHAESPMEKAAADERLGVVFVFSVVLEMPLLFKETESTAPESQNRVCFQCVVCLQETQMLQQNQSCNKKLLS